MEVKSVNHLDLQGIPLISYFGYLWLWYISFEARSSTISKILKMSLPFATWNHVLSCFSCVLLCATLWTVARQAPLSMGILQARILEWVAMPYSRGSSWPRDQTHVLCRLHWQAGSLPLRGTWEARRILQAVPKKKEKKNGQCSFGCVSLSKSFHLPSHSASVSSSIAENK